MDSMSVSDTKDVHYLVFPSFVWLAIPDRKFIERSWNAIWNAICDKKETKILIE